MIPVTSGNGPCFELLFETRTEADEFVRNFRGKEVSGKPLRLTFMEGVGSIETNVPVVNAASAVDTKVSTSAPIVENKTQKESAVPEVKNHRRVISRGSN